MTVRHASQIEAATKPEVPVMETFLSLNFPRIVQDAIAPVVFLTALAGLMNVFSTRLGRVADHVDRITEELERGTERSDFLSAELAYSRTLAGPRCCRRACGDCRYRDLLRLFFIICGAAIRVGKRCTPDLCHRLRSGLLQLDWSACSVFDRACPRRARTSAEVLGQLQLIGISDRLQVALIKHTFSQRTRSSATRPPAPAYLLPRPPPLRRSAPQSAQAFVSPRRA